jgi:hypothetical protein
VEESIEKFLFAASKEIHQIFFGLAPPRHIAARLGAP